MVLKHGDSDNNILGIVRIAEFQDRQNKEPTRDNHSLYIRCMKGTNLARVVAGVCARAEVQVPSRNGKSLDDTFSNPVQSQIAKESAPRKAILE